jgi:hypothetical protein
MNDFVKAQAEEDFAKVRGAEFLNRVKHLIDPERDMLLDFTDVKSLVKPKGEVYRGMQVVPIDLIVGSEGRYADFNRFFQPRSDFLKARWKSIDEAAIKNIILPPIQLYEIGGVYFVRDGNHRVSVARMQGVEAIDAEVTSLSSEIKVKPAMTKGDLKRAVIQFEKREFYADTLFGDITNDYGLNFSVTGRYNEIVNQLHVHKYFMDRNRDDNTESEWPAAILSWYNNVYVPIVAVIAEEKILKHFPKRTSSDLYLYIVRRWDYLKKEGENVSVETAAKDFAEIYGQKKKWIFGPTQPEVSEERLENPYD